MKYFFAIFLWSILGFIFALNAVQNRADEEYEILGTFELTKIATKLLLADFASFDEDMVTGLTDSKEYVWAIGMIFALVLIIIMLNLLIAFINDSYAKLANI